MPVKGVIFDLDGTLVDTLDDLTDSMNAALAALGCAPRQSDECREMIGDGLTKFAERALGHDNAAQRDRLIERMKAHYRTHCCDKTRPYDGMPEVIAALRQRGILLAVLTNKNQEPSEIIVRHYFGDEMFSPVVGHAPGRAVKPDPQGVFEILKAWGVPASDVRLVGDSEADAETAVNAGIGFIGCEWGFRSPQQLVDAGAKLLIDRPGRIVECLDILPAG